MWRTEKDAEKEAKLSCARCGTAAAEKMTGRFFFIRHGETDWNREGLSVGSVDIPLNDAGRAQAKETALRIKESGIGIDLVVSSPLSRAKEFADIVSGEIGVPVVIEEWLRERNTGDVQGKPESPEDAARLFDPVYSDAIPGAEKLAGFEARIRGPLFAYPKRYPAGSVLFVWHGFAMKEAVKLIKGLSVEETVRFRPPGNADMLTFATGKPCAACGSVFFE